MCEEQIFNWNNTVISRPEKIWYPKRTKDIPNIIDQAILHNKRIRVVGPSRHTWSGISSTDDNQWTICMEKINDYRLNITDSVVRVGAGLTLDKLNKYLEIDGYHLENMGGAMKQCIGGLIATATHGSGLYGSFSDLVECVELYTSANTSGKRIIRRGNPDFPAVCTHLGVLGIITHITLRVIPLYNIHMTTKKVSNPNLDELKTHEYHHVLYFSHTNDLIEYTGDRIPAKRSKLAQIKDTVSDEIRTLTQEALIYVGQCIPQSISFFQGLAARFTNNSTKEDIGYRVLTTSDVHGIYNFQSVLDVEFAVPAESVYQAYQLIKAYLQVFPEYAVAGSWRFVPASEAWMAPMYGRDTCCIDLVFLRKTVPTAILEGIQNIMLNFGGRPHWGKWNTLTLDHVKQVYPSTAIQSFIEVRRRYDPENIFLNDYTRPIFL